MRYEFFIHIIFLMSLWHSQIMHNFFVFKSRSLGDTLAHQSEVYRETARDGSCDAVSGRLGVQL